MPKIQSNCKNCHAKKCLIPVFTKIPIPKTSHLRMFSYDYSSHSDKTVFYICKKCGFHQNFRINEIISVGMFKACFPKSKTDLKKLKNIQSQKDPYCIYCECKEDPPRPRDKTEYRPTMIKLYVKKPRRKFLGYFCVICRRAYYLHVRIMKWKNSEFYKIKRVELLGPLNSHLTEKEKKEHPKWNNKNKIIKDNRKLACIGDFTTSEGPEIGPIEGDYLILSSLPKKKQQKILKILRE